MGARTCLFHDEVQAIALELTLLTPLFQWLASPLLLLAAAVRSSQLLATGVARGGSCCVYPFSHLFTERPHRFRFF